eukprot:COSAG02_NODE_861_length_16429_cov_75.930680_10_plen_43_part_00
MRRLHHRQAQTRSTGVLMGLVRVIAGAWGESLQCLSRELLVR